MVDWLFDSWASLGRVLVIGTLAYTAAGGAARRTLTASTRFGRASTLTLRWTLIAGERHLRATAEIDWREDRRLLRFQVPTRWRGRMARFGCPFGAIDRPQQPGDERAEAMWEVPGSRWAAVLDDAGAGLAVLTEASYGFSARDGVLGLSLLRAAVDPDPTADRGAQVIHWALGTHVSRATAAQPTTAAAADTLFAPVLPCRAALSAPPIHVLDAGTLAPSWLQPLPGACVLRLHEVGGAHGSARIAARHRPVAVALAGTPLRGVRIVRDGDAWRVHYAPFQVIGLRVPTTP